MLRLNAFIPAIAALAFPVLGAAETLLNGAGATFPNPIYQKWFGEFAKAHPDVQINYTPNGSGGGIKGVTDGTVDFGASDMPMTDRELSGFVGHAEWKVCGARAGPAVVAGVQG